jgi:hypothetical protein
LGNRPFRNDARRETTAEDISIVGTRLVGLPYKGHAPLIIKWRLPVLALQASFGKDVPGRFVGFQARWQPQGYRHIGRATDELLVEEARLELEADIGFFFFLLAGEEHIADIVDLHNHPPGIDPSDRRGCQIPRQCRPRREIG